MSYITSIVVSVLILGTLLISTNYKVRKRDDEFEEWYKHEFVDKGRVKFPIWIYLISIFSSLIFIWNYIYTLLFVIVWMFFRFKEYKWYESSSLEEVKVYLNNKIINKIIEFLNKGI